MLPGELGMEDIVPSSDLAFSSNDEWYIGSVSHIHALVVGHLKHLLRTLARVDHRLRSW